MGKNSGGVRGGLQPGDFDYKGKVPSKTYALSSIKEPDVYREVKSAVSRYEAVLGVRQRSVRLANLPQGNLGVHMTRVDTGTSSRILLNKKHFDQKKSVIEAQTKKSYDSGWTTKTNKPIAHTVTHELAHATWNSHLKSANARAATPSIQRVYKQWKKDKKSRKYGKYARTNINEFFAETVTKGIHGKSDKYTNALISIVKNYKL